MSRTKHAAELCTLLVEEVYGELPSRVFAVLLRRGRLPIPALITHTRIKNNHLRHGLAVLVQQNLVYHYHDPESRGLTYYEANADAAYALVRSGKVLQIIKSRYGNLAEDVVQNLLLLGHTRVGDLQDAYSSKATKLQANGHTNGEITNGLNGDHEKSQKPTQSELNYTLCQLLEAGFIEPVTEAMFRSPADTYNLVEREILQNKFGGGTKGVKQKEDLKLNIRSRLNDLREEGKDWQHYCTGYKSAANGRGPTGTAKRQKLDNGASNGGTVTLNAELVVRVSYDKCAVALRTQDLTAFAHRRVGETTALVYGELLRAIEDKIPRCRLDPNVDDDNEDQDNPTISTMELSTLLDPSINISTGIGKVSSDKIDISRVEKNQTSRKRKADEAEVVGDASSDEDEDGENGDGMDVDRDDDYSSATAKQANGTKVTFQDKPVTAEDRQNRMTQLKQHLMLLSEDKRGFVKRCGTQGLGQYMVEFEGLIERLREEELDTIITQRFGEIGARLSRILREKGKLDEKQMLTFGLVKQKDIRTKMTEMHMAGFADIQEVPRDASRTPGRTIFLWFFDTERVTQMVLDSIYKAMSRALQVLDDDRKNEADVIALSERSDVKTEGEHILPAELLNRLTNVREREQKLLGQINRLDTLIGVFRDY